MDGITEGAEMKTPEQMALEYIKDVETARNPSITATAFPQMQRCFLAGYEAAKDQFADTSKVMNSSNNSNGWISVKERLPALYEVVLVSKGPYFRLASLELEQNQAADIGEYKVWREIDQYRLQDGFTGCLTWNDITHWMPLPEAPKEEYQFTGRDVPIFEKPKGEG